MKTACLLAFCLSYPAAGILIALLLSPLAGLDRFASVALGALAGLLFLLYEALDN